MVYFILQSWTVNLSVYKNNNSMKIKMHAMCRLYRKELTSLL